MNRPDSDLWLEVCLEELAALRETKTYIPVHINNVDPHNIVGCHWVFALKCSPDGEVERYKAHIVAKGFNQVYSIDCDKTFAPVVKWVSICILLSLAACLNLEVHQMDIKTMFLNGELKHEIFMSPLPGCSDYGSKDVVWRLEKSLYGLKQSSRAWYMKAKTELHKLQFKQSDSDHAVFSFSTSTKFCIIALYVDNLMIISNSPSLLRRKKRQLMSAFKMKDLGDIHWFLGLEITHDRARKLIFVSQSWYIADVVERFGFANS